MKEDYIVGLDLGTNSVGWAVVNCVKKEGQWCPTGLVDLNSYIFQEVVDAKQVTFNAVRRQKRLARRQTKRRARRCRELVAMLRQHGLLPEGKNDFPYLNVEQANAIDGAFAVRIADDKQETKKYKNPFAIRAIGLEKELEPYELGRAILHLQSHRGYRSNEGAKYVELLETLELGESLEDKDDVNESNEDKKDKKKVLSGISELENEMAKAKVETVGQYVWHKIQNGDGLSRITGYSVKKKEFKGDKEEEYNVALYARRDMTQKEFDLIWEKQKAVVDKSMQKMKVNDSAVKARDKINGLLFEQYPIGIPPPRHRHKHISYNLVGKCTLEPKKNRCRTAWPEAQEFRTRQIINNLRIDREPLLPEQRTILFNATNDIDELTKDGRINWTKVAKCLGVKKNNLNYPDEGDLKSGLVGNRTKRTIADTIGNEDYTKYTEDLLTIVNKKALYERLVKLGLSAGKDGKALALTMLDLETSYMKYSLKAIRKLLPHLREGNDLHDSLVACGYNSEQKESKENSGSNKILNTSIPQIANPRVQKAAYATRRVVNAIIKKYGKRPVQINIEMARELKANKEEKANISKQNTANRKANINAEQELAKANKQISYSNINKYKCWHDEQNCLCPYCGKSMGLAEVFQDGRNQWEHILPQSEFKQNYMNRVVACWDCNNKKGGRTPYQAWGNTEMWKPIENRMKKWTKLPKQKKRRILSKESVADSEDFCKRALQDTQYITTIITGYFRQEHIKVQAGRGQATSELRYRWGLNNILPTQNLDTETKDKIKSRIDHRHHAVDAFVIALTGHKILMQLTEHMQYERDCKRLDSEAIREARKEEFMKQLIPTTWQGGNMCTIVRNKLLDKNVAIQKKKKVQGALHEETIYGRSHYSTKEKVPERIDKSFMNRIEQWLEYKPNNNGMITNDGNMEWISDPQLYDKVKSWYEENKDKPANKRASLNLQELPIEHRCYTVQVELEKAIKYISSPEWEPAKKRRVADKELYKILYKWKEENSLVYAEDEDENIKKAIETTPPRMPQKKGNNGATINNGPIIKKVRIAMNFNAASIRQIPGRGIVVLGGNHHVSIFINKKEQKRKARIVTAMNAALRQSKEQSIVDKKPDPAWGEAWECQATLCKGDLVEFDTNDSLMSDNTKDKIKKIRSHTIGATKIYRVQTISPDGDRPDIQFRLVSIASVNNKYGLIRIRSANDLAIKRVELGVLGS